MVKWVGYNMHVAMQKPLPMMEYRDKSGDDEFARRNVRHKTFQATALP
jgi:hypothetical protein